jgi:sirohydrochlorin ferrochelatase
MSLQTITRYTTILLFALGVQAAAEAAPSKVGFLVLAPDRGYLGNKETSSLVDEFKQTYPAALGFVGRDEAGVEGDYASYLTRAVRTLKEAGVTRIVAIPLFVSESDPLLARVKALLPTYAGEFPVRWTSAMSHDYLIGQIVLDRVTALSEHPETERVILVGAGAVDEASEQAMKTELHRLLAYVNRYRAFRETEAVILYERDADRARKKNDAALARIMSHAAKAGRTLVIPTFIGPKLDSSMSLSAWLGTQFGNTRVAYRPEELLPHPNVLLWLMKTANRETPLAAEQIGVVVMPHGSTQPWNDAVEATILPLMAKYPIEMAYGMGDPFIIQDAVSRLERRGIRHVVFVRLYALDHHMKSLTDYILGLSDQPPGDGHDGGHGSAGAPPQVRTAVTFSTFGGYEQNPDIATVLHKRIAELSQDPTEETVLLLAHGDGTDEGDNRWIAVMNEHIARLRQEPHCAKFKGIKAFTVREDWPGKREQAVAAVRATIEEASRDSRVLVIAHRLYGAGPYRRMLAGLNFELNDKGLADPILTRWLDERLTKLMAELTSQNQQTTLAQP